MLIGDEDTLKISGLLEEADMLDPILEYEMLKSFLVCAVPSCIEPKFHVDGDA